MNHADTLKTLSVVRKGLDFAQERAKLEFATQLHQCMDRAEINQRGLSAATEKSEPYISKALRGDANLTIETMVALAHGCNSKIHFKLAAAESMIRWAELINCAAHRIRVTETASSWTGVSNVEGPKRSPIDVPPAEKTLNVTAA